VSPATAAADLHPEEQGFRGANLQRPGLEQIRDLAAEGQLQAVLVYSPDRSSRKYAYQVLPLWKSSPATASKPPSSKRRNGSM
jgi:hypothetical protein